MKSPIFNYFFPERSRRIDTRKLSQGFTFIELIVVMAIFAVLVGLATVSLSNFERTASIASEVNKMIPDIKQQQIKAMSGDTEGSGTPNTYGIYIASTSYTLFRGTYSAGSTDNLVINLPDNIQLTTSFTNNQIIFQRGSGETSGGTVTFTDTTTGNTRVMTINRYGVVEDIN